MKNLIFINIACTLFYSISVFAQSSFESNVKKFDTSSMGSIPWGEGRPASIDSVPKNLLNCLSEVSFTHRLAPFTDDVATGKIVVNNDLVADLVEIFEGLFKDPTFSMTLATPIDHFNWNDDLSMEADNTSGFNFRYISGTKKLSNHSKGRAIDVNPRVNPWVNNAGTKMFPENGSVSINEPGSLLPGAKAHHLVALFKERGFEWGGDWTSFKDYQHFEIKISYPGSKYCEAPWE